MRKSTINKLTSLIMAFIMSMVFASTALAGTYSWTDSEGNYYLATVTKGSNTTRNTTVSSSSTHHQNGSYTVIGNGPWYVSYTGSMSFNMYSTQLKNAAQDEGLYPSISQSKTFETTVSVPASAPSGYYCIRATILGNPGNYSVKLKESGSTTYTILTTGSFNFGIRMCSGAPAGYYVLSFDD